MLTRPMRNLEDNAGALASACTNRFALRLAMLTAVMLASTGGALDAARAAAASASTSTLMPPVPVTTALSNGLRVAVFPSHRLPIVEISLLFPAGQTAESSGESGAAALTASLLVRGTSSRDAEAFEAAVARLGGSVSAAAGRDVASVDGQFLADGFAAGLELVSDAALNPLFDESEVAAAVARARRTLQRVQYDPSASVEVQMWSAVLGDRAYGRSMLGRDSTLTGMNAGVLSQFHRAHYRPDRALLVVAGDVSPDSVFAAAEERFGSWGGRAAVPSVVSAPRGPGHPQTVILDSPRLPITILRLGLALPGRRSSDDLPLSVAASRFSGGMAAWTNRARVRESLGSSVAATLYSMRDGGLYSFGVPVPTDSVGAAVRLLEGELRDFTRAFPADSDLDVLRRAAQTEYLRQFETLSGTIGQWGEAALLELPEDATRQTAQRLATLSAAEIRAAAARWLVPESLSVVAAGPAKGLETQLAGRGAVRVVPAPAPPSMADTLAETPENSAEAKRIVDRALAAHGGADSLTSIHDSAIEMKISVGQPGFAGDGTVQELRKEPYRLASHMALKDFEVREVLNGNSAWSTRPKKTGFENADSSRVAALRRNFDGDVPHVLMALSHEPRRVARGHRRIESYETEVVDVPRPDGSWARYYFDSNTHLLVGIDEFSGVPGEAQTVARRVFGDYRDVSGRKLPFREQRILNGQTVMRVEIQTARLNIGVSDREFVKPKLAGE
jgi:predicted Zn-dependent peptidase